MDIVFDSLARTFFMLSPVLPVMFASLFGVEVLMRLGIMQKLEPLGIPLARVSHLPPQNVLAFLTSMGSLVAANTLLAQHHATREINSSELVIGSVFNTVPVHFKETFTFQLPVVLPLLGLRLCLIYIATFWLAGFLKLGFVIWRGRQTLQYRGDAYKNQDDRPGKTSRRSVNFFQILLDALHARWRLFSRMILILGLVTFAVQLLVNAGVVESIESFVAPLTSHFGLPALVIAPVSVYVVSPIAGLIAMSALLQQNLVTEYQAIVALLSGGFLMVPVTRLRSTFPRYISILGLRNGTRVIFITTGLSLVSRGLVLLWVLLFF